MLPKSDRWSLTWRDVKKSAIAALASGAIAIIGQSFNFDPTDHARPFLSLPTLNNLAIAGGTAFATITGDILRRLSTDRVKSAYKTIEKAKEKQYYKSVGL